MAEVYQNPIIEGKSPSPLFVVLSGPSGVGKDTILARMNELGLPFHFVVTANSRPPRAGEVDGEDYHFVTDAQFEAMIAQGAMLEWARVYGSYRGIPKSEVRDALASDKDVILRVNIDGAATIRQIAPEAILIFIAPSSLEELRHRLYDRNADSEEDIAHRLSLVEHEMSHVTTFDYIVTNREGALDTTVAQIQAIMTAERHRVFLKHITL